MSAITHYRKSPGGSKPVEIPRLGQSHRGVNLKQGRDFRLGNLDYIPVI